MPVELEEIVAEVEVVLAEVAVGRDFFNERSNAGVGVWGISYLVEGSPHDGRALAVCGYLHARHEHGRLRKVDGFSQQKHDARELPRASRSGGFQDQLSACAAGPNAVEAEELVHHACAGVIGDELVIEAHGADQLNRDGLAAGPKDDPLGEATDFLWRRERDVEGAAAIRR